MSIKSRAPKNLSLELESNLVQDNVPAEVVPGIFIGSIHAAFNHEALLELGITHVRNDCISTLHELILIDSKCFAFAIDLSKVIYLSLN